LIIDNSKFSILFIEFVNIEIFIAFEIAIDFLHVFIFYDVLAN
jgi:hypothetical protein